MGGNLEKTSKRKILAKISSISNNAEYINITLILTSLYTVTLLLVHILPKISIFMPKKSRVVAKISRK